jgi:hypothetical protein
VMAVEFGGDRVFEKFEEVAALFLAGRDRGPHPFVITLARLAAGALRNAAIDYAMADLLLAVIVRRIDPLGEHEPEVVLRQVVFPGFRSGLVNILHHRETRSEIRSRYSVTWIGMSSSSMC